MSKDNRFYCFDDDILIDEKSLKTNGGPGSGNFNPGQGRGVGKPSNKSKKLTYEEYAEKFKKLTRSEKEELDKEYPEYADRYFKELVGRHIQRERDEKSFGIYEKDNSHPHFDLDKVPIELKYALDITPTQGLKKYDPKTQTLIDLKSRKEYYNEEKGIWVRVISMSPRDYSNTIIENNNGHYTSMREIEDRTSKGGIDMYVEKFKNRERQEVPYIKFNKEGKFSGEQEGFHRSFAADEIGDKEIPVLIVTDYYGKQPFLNHGRDITKDVENYYASKSKKNSLTRNQRLDLIMNGGPGSGNFNPGQGRGVGKPANGSNKSFTTFSVDNYSKEKLNEVLEKYGVETDTNIGIAISNAAWRNGNKEDYEKVKKILEERYGEDWYDSEEAEKDKDYLEYLEKKAKRIEELQKKIYSELGIEFDSDSFWVSKDIYNGIQKAIKEGKLKEFINGDIPAAKEDPNFVRDPESAIGFYRQKSFNFDNGNFNVEVMNSSSESGYSDISEDNFINKSDYDNFMKRKMVKVNNDEVHSWYTILDKAGTYPPISRAEERSLQEYNLASAVNQQLREGKTSRTAENIASAINKKYSHSNEVYRGIRGDFAKKISSLKKGDTVTDKGFMSTSSIIGGDDSGAAKFGKTIMKIKTKSGFGQSIDMAPYVKDMRYLDEGEILLQKNTTVKYTGNFSKTIDKDGNDIMIYEFEVE